MLEQVEDANAARQTEQNAQPKPGSNEQSAPAGSTENEQNAQAGSCKNEQSAQAGSTENEQNAQSGGESQTESFSREYVEGLRRESGDYRTRATAAEKELHTFRVAALGKLADPDDMPYSAELADPEKLAAAVDELLARKPHLKARQVNGNIGQHENDDGTGGFSLAGLLRNNA